MEPQCWDGGTVQVGAVLAALKTGWERGVKVAVQDHAEIMQDGVSMPGNTAWMF